MNKTTEVSGIFLYFGLTLGYHKIYRLSEGKHTGPFFSMHREGDDGLGKGKSTGEKETKDQQKAFHYFLFNVKYQVSQLIPGQNTIKPANLKINENVKALHNSGSA